MSTEHRLDFGCHKGKPLADVPTKYLNWLREQSLPDPLALAVRVELRRRAVHNGRLVPDADVSPPVVAINWEGPVAELSFFLAEGERLSEDELSTLSQLLLTATLRAALPDGRTRAVLSPVAGFAIVPSAEAVALAVEVRRLCMQGRIR